MSIATDMRQGAVLVDDGVDIATADMHYTWYWDSIVESRKKWALQVGKPQGKDKPAWSLDKLIELLSCDSDVSVIFYHIGSDWFCRWAKRKEDGKLVELSRVGRTKTAAAFLTLHDLIKCGEIKKGKK